MAAILIVSHDLSLIQKTESSLVREHHEIIGATTVQQGLTLLECLRVQPELILADVGLKEFRGYEFVQALKAKKDWAEIPVLLLTKSQKCEIFTVCDGILVIPYTRRDLLHTVGLLIEARKTKIVA